MRFEVDTWKYGTKPFETAKIAQGSPRARWPFQKVGIFQKFCAYHYRRKNDIILALFDGEIMSSDESEGNLMKGRRDN